MFQGSDWLEVSPSKSFFSKAAVFFSEHLYNPLSPIQKSISIRNKNEMRFCLDFQTLSTNAFLLHNTDYGSTICESCLRLAQFLSGNETIEGKIKAVHLLQNILDAPFATAACRAKANHFLGLDFLKSAQINGELEELWTRTSFAKSEQVDNEDHSSKTLYSVQKAKSLFYEAAILLGNIASELARINLRYLALTTGPEESSYEGVGLSAGELVHTSIGISARLSAAKECSERNDRYQTLMSSLDVPLTSSERAKRLMDLYETCKKTLPLNWIFFAIALCPTGELLISRACRSSVSNNLTFKTACVIPNSSNEFLSSILKPFDVVMDKSRKQLSGISHEVATTKYNSDKEVKHDWWEERNNLDNDLKNILFELEENWFGGKHTKELFLGNCKIDDTDRTEKNLTSRFEAACTIKEREGLDPEECRNLPMKVTKEALKALTVVKLKERLSSMGVTSKVMRPMRKAGLIDLLFEKLKVAEEKHNSYQHLKERKQGKAIETCHSNQRKEKDCIFLILDEHLQSLPFEGMPMFHDQIVCRLPSFPFAAVSLLENTIETLGERPLPLIDPLNVSYVLDPDSNLSGTKDRLYPFLEEISEHNKWDWDGVVGQMPSVNYMNDVLTRDRGLFLYCGHGGGERFFSRSDIEGLTSNGVPTLKDSQQLSRSCQSCIVLMGCSSAKLNSVNSSKHDHCREGHIHIEPEGIALNYLIAGAPCVIGNLWDVTDRDIDR